MKLTARPYQEEAIKKIREHYVQGTKKTLLQLPTGSGKTYVFCQVLKGVYEKGNRAIMVVRGASLVDQASLRLAREDVPHGVMQANHWRKMPDEPIQICSIDTLYRRKIAPPADLVVIDEAHLAGSQSYMWLVEQYPDAYFLPVTATPHLKKGLRHIADVVVNPITIAELIEQGYLVPARYYIPTSPDISSVSIDKKTSDYNQSELSTVMRNSALYGDMIDSYLRRGENRPALCFAVNVEHSLELVDSFNYSGIPAVHVEAGTSQADREDAIRRLETGEIKIISNVGVLTTGVDIPCVSCIILARPTKSYNLHIQTLGRGTRLYPGKKDFIVLDHANNVMTHGLIETDRECNLDGAPPKPRENVIVTCKVCFHAWNPIEQYRLLHPGINLIGYDYICRGVIDETVCLTDNAPERKANAPVERKTDTDLNHELVEVDSKELFEKVRLQQFIEKQILIAKRRGYKPGWIFHQLKEKYSEDVAKKHWKHIKASLLPATA
jgi:superfamily II DNA or RNA helicase